MAINKAKIESNQCGGEELLVSPNLIRVAVLLALAGLVHFKIQDCRANRPLPQPEQMAILQK